MEPCAICGKPNSNNQEHYDESHKILMEQLKRAEKETEEGRFYTHEEVFGEPL